MFTSLAIVLSLAAVGLFLAARRKDRQVADEQKFRTSYMHRSRTRGPRPIMLPGGTVISGGRGGNSTARDEAAASSPQMLESFDLSKKYGNQGCLLYIAMFLCGVGSIVCVVMAFQS